ncbi:hypothetical protein NAV33_11945 [Pseudomonas stutzeri]|uniref:hypothetical protein n=1 Tax=Stutzerimonas stutzeri TaxID=316 RepID=UPI00210DEAE3|nr:hypothetical protein [Stutzerimonas stutzeri]MCQ4312606.1 hypothetical protein [Stutzerimonas stutzeri]
MNSPEYIFASCKQWHRPCFEQLEHDIPARWIWVSHPDELLAAVRQANPRYIFFLHWNWLVPQTIWQRYECVCFHMTDVPYGRGGSPLQNLIAAGHSVTKLTALRMVEVMDAGPIYAKHDMPLSGSAQEIYLRAGALSADIIRWMVAVEPEPMPQDGEVVLFRRRVPEQSRLPQNADLDQLYDLIRMLDADGYPHAFIEYGDFRLQFRAANREDGRITAQVTIQRTNRGRNNDC